MYTAIDPPAAHKPAIYGSLFSALHITLIPKNIYIAPTAEANTVIHPPNSEKNVTPNNPKIYAIITAGIFFFSKTCPSPHICCKIYLLI